MFRAKRWKGVYRSDTDNLLEDFYLTALQSSVSYDRAVGFFSATMLAYAAQGVAALVENGGTMRLVFGGEIDEEDAVAIASGYDQRLLAKRIGDAILTQIDNLSETLANYRLSALSWLIASGRLDIKLALKRRGMYHEKIGIFSDNAGDQLIFQGSANETTYALLPDFNFESINVFPSWRTELVDHYQPYVDGFERLWKNETKDTYVIEFPEAVKERLVKIASRTTRPPRAEIELDVWKQLTKRSDPVQELTSAKVPKIPLTYKGQPFEIQRHQREALNSWRSRDFHGILAMATGAGKTVTSIYGLVKLFERTQRLFVVIAVPYQALGDQWIDELSIFNIEAIPCYVSTAAWADRLTQSISLFEVGALRFCACVVVNRTLESAAFRERLARIPGETMAFVGDECHHHGAPGLNAALPDYARIRLGLSATPRHYFDEQRTSSLLRYYGEVAYEYSLSDALRDKVLTPYNYYVHFVDLTASETEDYLDLCAKISRIVASGQSEDLDDPSDDQLKTLLFKRARLLGNACNKLTILESLLRGVKPSPFHLFYCGDGVNDDADEDLARQVDRVSKVLYNNGWKVSHFTSRESRDGRKTILENFRIRVVDALVAIRCLDEGVDVPDCRVAYVLASSRNPKQFIQRRGRILRRAHNKDVAVVHDFLVRLPDVVDESSNAARQLLVDELSRISEFGRLAQNRSQVYETLKPLLEQYDLQHHFV